MANDPRSDQILIAGANNGDDLAFVALYERHRDWVARLAERFTGNQEDAMDVLQETFSYLLGKFPGFTLTASMTTFLYPVVRHLSLAALRKRRRQNLTDDELLNSIPARPVPQGDPRRDLAELMQCLPAIHREIILMRFVDSLTLEEIGQALSIPLGTVKSRLHTALTRLREDNRTLRYFLTDFLDERA